MAESRNFPFALGVSLITHICLILAFSLLNIPPQARLRLKPLEVTYLKISPRTEASSGKKLSVNKLSPDILDSIRHNQDIALSSKDILPKNNSLSLPEIGKDVFSAKSGDPLLKPAIPKTEIPPADAIRLSNVELEASTKLSRNPAYLTYSNFLRERIRRCLYNKFSALSDNGIVCLKFALDAEGRLLEYNIIESKSSAGSRLKKMAEDGLREAGPFPPLPKELNTPAATFSVIIHFIEQKEAK